MDFFFNFISFDSFAGVTFFLQKKKEPLHKCKSSLNSFFLFTISYNFLSLTPSRISINDLRAFTVPSIPSSELDRQKS